MKKLLIVIHSLAGGGAERVVSRILAHLAQHRPDIDLNLALIKPRISYTIPSSVKVTILADTGPSLVARLLGQVKAVVRLRRLMATVKPDAVLSFMPTANLFSIAARATLPSLKTRVVVSERVALDANYKGRTKAVLFSLMKALYPRADKIVCVAQGVLDELVGLGIPAESGCVIHNSVDTNELQSKASERAPHEWALDKSQPLLVSTGRLTQQKGQDVLVKALEILQAKAIRPRVMIFGVGELKEALEAQITAAGLSDTVKLMGFNANPYPELAQANAFIFPSRWEGFPNALLEAMALGVPVISTDCPFGPRELIGDNEFGTLVPVDESNALATAIEQLLASQGSGPAFEEASKRSSRGAARFSPEQMIEQYLKVLFPA